MKSMLQSVCLLLALLSPLSQGHMWLRTPLSRGGINNIGGTSGPCNGLQAGSGTKTTYEVGQSVTFQFRVNQHGPNPFKFALSTSGDTFSTVLVDNIPNTVTAGADGFQGVNVAVTIPDNICSNCAIQLSGMGQTSGSGTWYNCADIEIVAAGQGGFPLVTGVSPATGATAGGTTVTVTGSRFGSSQSTQKCKFGSTIVAATWISDTSLTCVSPIYNVPTEVALEVSRDGTTYSSSGEIFTYTGDALPPIVSSISPKKGDIGTPLIIDGQNFFSSDVQCKFGNVTVSAHYVSQTRVTCTVPYLDPSVSYTTVEVNVDGSPYSTSGVTFTISTRSGSASFLQPFSFLVFIAAALLAFLRF